MNKITELLAALLVSIAIFVAPIYGILITVGLFILADTCFGIWASKKLGIPILSRKMGRVLQKLLLYNMSVITFYCIDVFIFEDFGKMFGIEVSFLLTKIVGLALIGLEAYSIDEKVRNVKGYGLMHYFKKLVASAKFLKNEWKEINNEK